MVELPPIDGELFLSFGIWVVGLPRLSGEILDLFEALLGLPDIDC